MAELDHIIGTNQHNSHHQPYKQPVDHVPVHLLIDHTPCHAGQDRPSDHECQGSKAKLRVFNRLVIWENKIMYKEFWAAVLVSIEKK